MQEPAVFWNYMRDFYEQNKARMQKGDYKRPYKVQKKFHLILKNQNLTNVQHHFFFFLFGHELVV